jgi:predicted MFS family arabinose efflux permease
VLLSATKGAAARPAASAAHDPRYRWAVLVVATLAVFGALGLGRFGYSSVLPSMQKNLGFSNVQAGALATWNLVGYVLMAVVAGVVATRFGARPVIAVGLVVAGVAMAATGLVHGFAGASAARLFTGVGAGVVNVPAVALMSLWFGARRRGLASGFVVSGSSLALVLVGPTVPRIISAGGPDGWRNVWFIFGAITIVLAVVAALVLRNRPHDAGAALLPDGAPAAAKAAQPRRSLAKDARRVFGSPYFWSLGVVYVAFGFSYMIYMTFFVRRLTGDVGLSADRAGSLFMVLGWSSLVCGVLWGWVSDVIGRKFALAIVLTMHATAFALFALWTGTMGLTLSALIFGVTAWSVPGIMGAACADGFGPALASSALGFLTLFLGVGQAAGPLVGGAMADRYSSFTSAFLLAAGVAACGAVAALFIRRAAPASAVQPASAAAGERAAADSMQVSS